MDLGALIRQLMGHIVALEQPQTPIAITSFLNSWVNYDAPRPATYYKSGGRVYLAGQIKSGTVNSSAFTLPAGYRPLTGNVFFAVESNSAYGAVYVSTAGDVVPASPSSNVYVSLHGISFRAIA